MGKLIVSNTTTFCIAMSSNANFEFLSCDLCALRHDPHENGKFLVGVLNQKLFTVKLQRELLRLERYGGFLSLLCSAVDSPTCPVSDSQEQALAVSLRQCLEPCDSMGCLEHGCYTALLPGIGQIRARRLAQQLQKLFTSRLLKTARAVQYGDTPRCAVGLLCVDRHTADSVVPLLDKVRAALAAAQAQPAGYIYQEGPDSMNDRITQVQSDEKRFLFFGGGL